MEDYDLFEKALNEYEKHQKKDVENSCKHESMNDENGIMVCVDCGFEVEKTIFHDKEWRYYGQNDNKRLSDPNRVQQRKIEDRNIFKDVENFGFTDKIVSLANQLYIQVTKGQIFRGSSRKALIFAVMYHSFKLHGKPQTHDKLITLFELNRKTGLKGLKYVNLNIPKDSIVHTTYITPLNLVDDIMDKFSATKEHKEEVYSLYEKIRNKSSKINRSRPQSISSGLIYYWICAKGLDISIKEFASKTELSELTINKIAKEISLVLNTPHIL